MKEFLFQLFDGSSVHPTSFSGFKRQNFNPKIYLMEQVLFGSPHRVKTKNRI